MVVRSGRAAVETSQNFFSRHRHGNEQPSVEPAQAGRDLVHCGSLRGCARSSPRSLNFVRAQIGYGRPRRPIKT